MGIFHIIKKGLPYPPLSYILYILFLSQTLCSNNFELLPYSVHVLYIFPFEWIMIFVSFMALIDLQIYLTDIYEDRVGK